MSGTICTVHSFRFIVHSPSLQLSPPLTWHVIYKSRLVLEKVRTHLDCLQLHRQINVLKPVVDSSRLQYPQLLQQGWCKNDSPSALCLYVKISLHALYSEISEGFCVARYVAALCESESSTSQKLLNDVVVKLCTIHMFQCNLQKLEFVCLLPIYI